jgi:UDP:flavonoid glycosyltransferase YjiC (YdhE family)
VFVFLSGVDEAGARRLCARNLRVVCEPVDLERAARLCGLAILNAGHGATSAMLREGTPILAIPLHLEQFLVARRMVATGSGQIASQGAADQIGAALQRLLVDPRFGRSARVFADRYAGFDPAGQLERVVERIEILATPIG